jgi:glutathione S-transferase
MIAVHHLNDSRSQRVLWLLEEFGLPYEAKRYERNAETMLAPPPMPFFVRPIARSIAGRAKSAFIGPQIDLHLDYVEGELGKATWFAGSEFTAADIQMSFPLEAAAARGGPYELLR